MEIDSENDNTFKDEWPIFHTKRTSDPKIEQNNAPKYVWPMFQKKTSWNRWIKIDPCECGRTIHTQPDATLYDALHTIYCTICFTALMKGNEPDIWIVKETLIINE